MAAIFYLSPHPDDVALACGASAAADAASGESVTVVTVFNAGRDRDRREAEDREAAALLGAALVCLDLPDAPGRPEVRGALGLFAPLSPRHLGVLSEVVRRLRPLVPEGARLVAPLGVGGHIDHRLAHCAARALVDERPLRLAFYEDQPYSRARYAVGRRLAAVGATLPPGVAPERGAPAEEVRAYRRYLEALPMGQWGLPGLRRLGLHLAARAAVRADRPAYQPGFPLRLCPRARSVEEHAARRFAAVAAYQSQWPQLFPSLREMERALRGGEGPLREMFWEVA